MNDQAMIQSIAEAVVHKLEPILLERFGEIRDRLGKIELQVAPVAGRTIHDIKNHLAVGSEDLGRLADSYEKLVEVLNVGMERRQAHIKIIRRLDDLEFEVNKLKLPGIEDESTEKL